MSWITAGVALATAVGGAVMSKKASDKANRTQQQAIDANKDATDEANQIDYAKWLQSKGVGNRGEPINTWLPRYAQVRTITEPGKDPVTKFYAAPYTDNTLPSVAGFAPAEQTVAPASYSRSWGGLGVKPKGAL